MNRAEILAKVIAVTSDSLDVDASELSEQTDFKQLGADSFDLLELVTAFEEEFEATMDDDQLAAITTIGDAVDAIEQAL
ncbi:MAG: acyl carrier protein [Coriobacteriales bacterium]|jgi:acyl carrier protein|nr:acyl carrier protein [Coriobacteriales bacterium]MDO5710097.1 acyl carrier protein [Coriobacteriales bacterium]